MLRNLPPVCRGCSETRARIAYTLARHEFRPCHAQSLRRRWPCRSWKKPSVPASAPIIRGRASWSRAPSRKHTRSLRTPPDARIVLIGGDGTINRMLPPLVRTTRELGIVPLGSGNDVARALGLFTLPWPDALVHMRSPRRRRRWTRVVTFGEREVPFLACCTCGLIQLLRCARSMAHVGLRGLPRYLLATLKN